MLRLQTNTNLRKESQMNNLTLNDQNVFEGITSELFADRVITIELIGDEKLE